MLAVSLYGKDIIPFTINVGTADMADGSEDLFRRSSRASSHSSRAGQVFLRLAIPSTNGRMYNTEIEDITENGNCSISILITIDTELTKKYTRKIIVYQGRDNQIADSVRNDLQAPTK